MREGNCPPRGKGTAHHEGREMPTTRKGNCPPRGEGTAHHEGIEEIWPPSRSGRAAKRGGFGHPPRRAACKSSRDAITSCHQPSRAQAATHSATLRSPVLAYISAFACTLLHCPPRRHCWCDPTTKTDENLTHRFGNTSDANWACPPSF
ncbi:hypothetical protein B0H67DRAFT_220116 [Lasiosphaeris hirsuta]|uniref:Uncharacterized protein n=1 Tax=Lasiosphaeris hirsuta TaxID=260670 RepID=A0AA40AF47_9PEZI|nr:hypothetical protein B0H67DRAFT_220116 [Lasiosphaeris hirsuta]